MPIERAQVPGATQAPQERRSRSGMTGVSSPSCPRFLFRDKHESRPAENHQPLVMQLIRSCNRSVLRLEHKAAESRLRHHVGMPGDEEAPIFPENTRMARSNRRIGEIDIYLPSISRLG